MRIRAHLAVMAAVAAAPLLSTGAAVPDTAIPADEAGPGVFVVTTPAALQEPLAFTSSPGTAATYRVADSTAITMQSPMGPMDLTNIARATLAVSFESDPAGFRATAAISEFSGSAGNSQMGTQTMSGSAVGGAIVAVVGPGGLAELVAKPDLSREAGQFTLFEGMGYDLFPRLPASAVATGDSWTDTVTWSSTAGGARTSSTRVRTFTVGEEINAGDRKLQMIAVSATVELSSEIEQGRMTIERSFSGTQTGYYFWDPGTGLLHAVELMSEFTGEADMGRGPPVRVTLKGLQRIWREY